MDLDGNGVALTSPAQGVMFDLGGTGKAVRTAWIAAGSDDGFLVVDVNGNGLIDSGREMLGNQWRRVDGTRARNGPEALVHIQGFDEVPRGNPLPRGLGFIDRDDGIFEKLRIWRDVNRDGVSAPAELTALSRLGIVNISLGFRKMGRTRDGGGNQFLVEGSFDVMERGVAVLHRMVEVELAGQ